MVTLLVGTTFWALLLTIMRIVNFPQRGYFGVSFLLLGVGAGLFVFRSLGRPLTISIASGVLFSTFGEWIILVFEGNPLHFDFGFVIFGAAFGFFAFFFYVAILVCSEVVRSLLSRFG